MSRPKGSIIGARPTWTTTATSGIWTLRQAEEMKADGKWPRGPVAPTSLAGTPGDGQVALTWVAPATTHGTIADYVIEYTPAAGSPTVVATGSTAASYTLTGLTNDTEYTIRVAAVNHTRGDWSSSVAVTPTGGGGQPAVSAPLNSYATTSTEATAYAVTASGVTNETYQWQALITDFNYTEGWQNLSGKTTAAITLQLSDFDSISYDGYGYVYVAIRCVVTHAGGSLTSNTAHHAQWWISHPMSFDVYTPNTYTYPDNSETIDGIAYSVFSSVSGEGVLITAMDMMNMGGGDYSWFTGDDFQFDVEQWTGAGTPTEAGADWSVIHSTSSRQYATLSYTIPESTGTKYYRVRTTRPWPLTVTDGSASAARGSFSANGAHVKVGWPSG